MFVESENRSSLRDHTKRPPVQSPRINANGPPYAHRIMTTNRTTLRLSDERKRLLDQAEEIVAADEYDGPPCSDVIDAALTHLIESHENIDEV